MTSEEKRDRRSARREVEAALRHVAIRKLGLYSTDRQIKAGLRVLVDRFYAEQVMPAAKRIESQVTARAVERASADQVPDHELVSPE